MGGQRQQLGFQKLFLKAISNCPTSVKMVEYLFAEVWEDIIIPEMWRKTPLYKNKGSRKECKNYRGLSIGSTFLKL